MNFIGNKKEKKMNVLMVVNNLRVANGVATVIMNQYSSLIKNGYEVDFLQFLELESPYIKEIKKNKGKIYTIGKNLNGIKNMFYILNNKKYDIIHINQMNLQTVILIILARLLKVKNIVYHSHNTKVPGGVKRNIQEKMCNVIYNIFANKYIACSKKAGEDSFGKKNFWILNNSIDIKKFKYNYDIRCIYRKKIDISLDTFVVGTVCRIAKQKNPFFVLDIISEIIKINKNAIFIWVGSAPFENDCMLKQLKEKTKELDIDKNILWLGSKEDVHNWYSIMDVFIMPSLWEGLGITYIESQANSLPTFASDVVPEDTKITNFIEYLSTKQTAKEWAIEICKYPIRNKDSGIDNYQNFINKGYDLSKASEDLLKIYNTF